MGDLLFLMGPLKKHNDDGITPSLGAGGSEPQKKSMTIAFWDQKVGSRAKRSTICCLMGGQVAEPILVRRDQS